MNSWQQRIRDQVPPWAQPTHTIFRHLQARLRIAQRGTARSLREAINLGMLIGVLTITMMLVHLDRTLGLDEPGTWGIFNLLYLPLLVIQFTTYAIALISVAVSIADYRQHGHWDTFKITSHGADLVVRARWAATFYQFRWLLLALIGARVIFIGLLLVDLTDQQGRALDQALVGLTPPVSLPASIPLLAALLAAALVQIVALFRQTQ